MAPTSLAQLKCMHVPVALLEVSTHLRGAVGAAVCYEHDLGLDAQVSHHVEIARDDSADVIGLVVDGQNQRDHEGVGAVIHGVCFLVTLSGVRQWHCDYTDERAPSSAATSRLGGWSPKLTSC